MADPYAAIRPTLKAGILEKVAAGTPIRSLCAEPGMPSDTTLRNWRKTDPTFDQMLGQALREGAWRRRWMFDPVRAEGFLARYRTGERMADILKDPAMPSRRVLEFWCGADQFFAEQVHYHRLQHQSYRLRGLREAKTSTPWDPKAADRVLVALVRGRRLKSFRGKELDLPGSGVIARWRKEQPEFDAEVRAALRIGFRREGTAKRRCADLKDTIVERIVEGHSLHSLARADPDMPCAETLYRWVREQPDFAQALGDACEDREDWYRDQMVIALDELGPATERAIRSRLAPWSRQLARLKHRPGKRRRAADGT